VSGSPNDPGSQKDLAFAEGVWLEAQKHSILDAPSKILEGAKQIIGLSTLLSGAYFTAVAFAQIGGVGTPHLKALFVAPIVFWVGAILFAIPAVVPLKEYETTLGDALAGKSIFTDLVIGKMKWLRLGLLFQVLGILAMLIVLWVRLSTMPMSIQGI